MEHAKRGYLRMILWAAILMAVVTCGCTTLGMPAPSSSDKTAVASTAATLETPIVREYEHRTSAQLKQFVRFAQCQFPIESDTSSIDLPIAKDPEELMADIRQCITVAATEKVDVLIFPELALQLPTKERLTMLEELKKAAAQQNMIIIGGSFYDENRFACVPIVGPDWIEFGHKLRPSRYECSTVCGKGMTPGPAIPVVHTDYGSFVILTCVDLISDEAQYVARRLATQRRIHTVINNCWNPSSLEFLIEANSIARRHPVFVQVTNTSNSAGFGHTSLLANLGDRSYSPNSHSDLLALLPLELVQRDETGKPTKRLLPYDCVVADIGMTPRAMLLYELNLLLPSVPAITNAPDQGYPPVRDLKIITFDK